MKRFIYVKQSLPLPTALPVIKGRPIAFYFSNLLEYYLQTDHSEFDQREISKFDPSTKSMKSPFLQEILESPAIEKIEPGREQHLVLTSYIK